MDICANNWYSRPKYSELACLWNPSSLPIAGSSVTIHVTETQNHGKVPVFGSFMVIFVDCNEIGCNICKARPTFGRCMLVFHKNNKITVFKKFSAQLVFLTQNKTRKAIGIVINKNICRNMCLRSTKIKISSIS